jgi:hypothetical protein
MATSSVDIGSRGLDRRRKRVTVRTVLRSTEASELDHLPRSELEDLTDSAPEDLSGSEWRIYLVIK